jgi:hypothetical protein
MTAVAVAGRWYYLKRILPGLRLVRYIVRAFLPTAAAAGVILGFRALADVERSAGLALAELAAYVALNVVITAVAERRLIAEALSYLRAASDPPRPA